jgi:hypothetical protein
MYWPDLNEIDDDRVNAAYAIIAQMIEEKCPDLNARRGVLGDLVTELHAILQGASMEAIERLRKSISAMELAQEPEDAVPAAVDALVSNYRITRRVSTKAAGDVTVVMDRAGGINFGTSSKFRANGQVFYVTRPVSVKPPNTTSPGVNDVLSEELDNGNFAVQVPVMAAEIHENAVLAQFDKLSVTPSPPGVLLAYATEDFGGGNVEQSNAELVQQMQAGAAMPGFASPESVKALIKNITFNVLDVAVVGATDVEMIRDRRGGEVSGGGKLDIYVRTRAFPKSRGITKNATLLSKTPTEATWEVTLTRDDAPGFYLVRDIRAPGLPRTEDGCTITDDARSMNTAGDTPDIQAVDEGLYSAYQEATITFTEETETLALQVGDKKAFIVTVLVMPDVDTIQNLVDKPAVRQPGLDVLIKAVKPAWVTVRINVTAAVDTDEFKRAAVAYVNGLGIGQRPKQFALARALPDSSVVSNVVIQGDTVDDKVTAAFIALRDVRVVVA